MLFTCNSMLLASKKSEIKDNLTHTQSRFSLVSWK